MSSLPSRWLTPEHSSAKRHPPKNELKLCGCWRNIAFALTTGSMSAIACSRHSRSRKHWRSQSLHAVLVHDLLHLGGTLLVYDGLAHLIKEFLESSRLTYQQQFSL